MSIRKLVPAVLLAFGLAVAASAGTYVSFDGHYTITYPDTWSQVEFQRVDTYLQGLGVDRSAFAYEAVFAPSASPVFHEGTYAILTLERVGQLSVAQIDSVLKSIQDSFGQVVVRSPGVGLDSMMTSLLPQYDDQIRTLTLITEPNAQDINPKRTLLATKFFEHGIVNFYFYAPDSTWAQDRVTFANILTSFTTENPEAALPVETLKVVDPKELQDESKTRNRLPFYGGGGALAIVLILVARRLRRRRLQNT